MRIFKTGLLMMSCLLATPALAIEVTELPGYSQMTVGDSFRVFLEKDAALMKKLADDAPLSRLIMSRAILQQQLMNKELKIEDIEATYFPNRNVTAEDIKAAEARGSTSADDTSAATANSSGSNSLNARGIIDKAVAAARSPQGQARSKQQIAALGNLNTPQARKQAQAAMQAETNAAMAGGGAGAGGGSAPHASAAGYATYEPEPQKDARDYDAMFAKLKEIIKPSSWIRLEAKPTGDPKYDSYAPGINLMRDGNDLKRVAWPAFFDLMDKIMAPLKPKSQIDQQQLLALLKAAAHQPEDLDALLNNPQVQERLTALKVDVDALFPNRITPQRRSVFSFIKTDRDTLDKRGLPAGYAVPDICPVTPEGTVVMDSLGSLNSAIYPINNDPASGITVSHRLGKANGYAMQNISVLSPLMFNNGLINEAVYAYCPGDFTGITPEGMPKLKDVCIASKPNHHLYRVHDRDVGRDLIKTDLNCLVPQQSADGTPQAGFFVNVRAKNVTLPPYVGPCLDEGPYPANYSSDTCGQKQATASGTCDVNIKETFSCYDSKNELPPQTFERTCKNGVWSWTQGYMTPASTRFRCEGTFTAADGTVTDYNAPRFDSTKLNIIHAANNPGDIVCAAHREGQIRHKKCGSFALFEQGFDSAIHAGGGSYEQCQFDTETNSYNWQVVSIENFPRQDHNYAYACHVRIEDAKPAACTLSSVWHREASNTNNMRDAQSGVIGTYAYEGATRVAFASHEQIPEGGIVKLVPQALTGTGSYTDWDADNNPIEATYTWERIVLENGKPTNADALSATYQCLARGKAINSDVQMLPAFYPVNGTTRLMSSFGSRGLPLKLDSTASQKLQFQ